MRTPGKNFDEFYRRAVEQYGVDYIKGMVGKDIPTVTECNELTVRADLDEETVYRLTKAFIENLDDIRKGCATWADCTPEKAAKDTGAPMHPGAVRYYKEAGLLK